MNFLIIEFKSIDNKFDDKVMIKKIVHLTAIANRFPTKIEKREEIEKFHLTFMIIMTNMIIIGDGQHLFSTMRQLVDSQESRQGYWNLWLHERYWRKI